MTETSFPRYTVKERIVSRSKLLFPRVYKIAKGNKLLSFLIISIIVLSAVLALQRIKVATFNQAQRSLNSEEGFEKLVIPERDQSFFELTTRETRRFGILPQETLTLKTQSPVNREEIISHLVSSVELNVKEVSDSEYELTPRSVLDLDEPLIVRLATEGKEVGGRVLDRDYSWAFQAQGDFQIENSIPGNEKTDVSENTGIEIIFNQDGFKDPTPYVTVSPSFLYETKIVDETFVIIPQQSLLPETVYTVTLKKGLSLKDRNDQIDEDYTFTFQTRERVQVAHKPRISPLDSFVQTSPNEEFATKVSTVDWSSDTKSTAVIYRFRSSEDFLRTRLKYDEETSSWRRYYANQNNYAEGLQEVLRDEVSVQEQEYTKFVQLNKKIEPGYYLVQFEVEGEMSTNQVWYQSTELSGYVSLGKEQTIVWANNIETKAASSGTTIRSVTTGGTWITNGEGVAKFPTSQSYFDDKTHYFVLTDLGGQSLVLPLPRQDKELGPSYGKSTDYWSYLYSEKVFYSATDTVNLWGIIKSRDTDSVPPAKVILTNQSGDSISERALSPSAEGTFTMAIPLDNVPDGWYTVTLLSGDVEVKSLSFSVQEYQKPDLKIEVTADKKAIFVDESVNFTTRTSFFEGTPGANIDLSISGSSSRNRQTVTTDENGVALYNYQPSEYSSQRNYPVYEAVYVNPAIAQNGILEGQSSVQVFGPRIHVTSESKKLGNRGYVEARLNTIDLTNINAGISNDYLGDTISGKSVNLKITENWIERKVDGTYYNFVEKVTYPRYRYERHSEVIKDVSLITDNNGRVVYDFEMKEGRSYDTVLEANDEKDRTITKKLYFYSSSWYDDQYSDDSIVLDLKNKDSNVFSVGDEVSVVITKSNELYAASEHDRFLFTNAQRGNQDVIVTNAPEYSFTFSESYKPNTYVNAIVFDGSHYRTTQTTCRVNWKCGGGYYGYWYGYNTFTGLMIAYDRDDSTFDIDISSSRSSYSPGEEATVSVSVTKDGTPIPGARVNLVLVDEAMVAIGGVREPDVMGDLYLYIPHDIYYVYTSHKPVVPDVPSAEKGGGGGDRSVFKDTALFTEVVTNENGNASYTFTLPDNITAWHIYAQGVSNNLLGGQSEGQIVVTKKFFVTSKFPKSYLEGDKTNVQINSFGEGVSKDSSVSYSLLVQGNDRMLQQLEKTAKVFDETSFSIPDLFSGEYTIIARGTASNFNDGVSLPLEVKKTRINQPYSSTLTVEDSKPVSSILPSGYLSDEPVTLIVSDKGKGIYFSTLRNYCYQSSNRLENKIAAFRANEVLLESFDYDDCNHVKEDITVFQGTDGGLGQVRWGGSDLTTTLWTTIVAKEEFDEKQLAEYFESVYNSSLTNKTNKIKAGWGASLVGESKLRELQAMRETVNSFEDKVTLATALAYLGDTETARNLYWDILADYGYIKNTYIRIDSTHDQGNTYEQLLMDTSQALILGELVDKKYNESLYMYITDFKTSLVHYLISLSEIEYIQRQIAALPDEDTRYRLTTAAGVQEQTLKQGNSVVYELTKRDMDVFSYVLNEGKSELEFRYFVGPNILSSVEKDDRLSIKRTYSKVNGSSDDFRVGDLVKVTLDLKLDTKYAPKGQYEITDRLPSGFTYVSNPQAYGLTGLGGSRNSRDNVVTFTTYNSPYIFINGSHTITYYARVLSTGKYKAETATFQSLQNLTVLEVSDEQAVEIK